MEIITGHSAIFSMFGYCLQAIVVVFAVIYVPPGPLLLGLVLRSFAIGACWGGGLRGLHVLFIVLFFHTELISLASASWTFYRPLLANRL